LPKYSIAETTTFKKKIAAPSYKKLHEKILTYIYPQLKQNPFFGPNIKKLKGQFEEFYRYRIGKYRLFYTIDNNQILVIIVDIVQRKDAYKK